MQTYDEILNRMAEKYTELTGITPSDASDIGIRLRVLAGEIYSNVVNTEWLKRQMFVATAEGEYLDMHGYERGIVRREATPSFGEVTFSLKEAVDRNLSIPKGSVVAGFASLLRFETTEDAVIFAGDLSVTVKAKSLGVGREYNLLEDNITVMVTPPAGVDSVTNEIAFTGGCNRESDESLRARIIESIKFPLNGTNCTFYESLAESVDGVYSASAVPKGRGVGTVDVYIAAQGTKASDEAVENAQDLLSKQREVNVDVLVKKAEPVTVDVYLEVVINEGYGFDDVKDRIRANVTELIASGGVGGAVLLCHISECVYHTEGVQSFSFVPQLNSDFRADKGEFPVAGTISVVRRKL